MKEGTKGFLQLEHHFTTTPRIKCLDFSSAVSPIIQKPSISCVRNILYFSFNGVKLLELLVPKPSPAQLRSSLQAPYSYDARWEKILSHGLSSMSRHADLLPEPQRFTSSMSLTYIASHGVGGQSVAGVTGGVFYMMKNQRQFRVISLCCFLSGIMCQDDVSFFTVGRFPEATELNIMYKSCSAFCTGFFLHV